ncbi:Ig-like domain-containing protein [Inediibacterium massiliense]|uniref:Ig-like domain-containing protein n=1 Tax=Inediibacterium massiliense TaxID=1658111 RepID=UPI0006B65EF5|nr:Ig-like domain-containing protein [Inediibacterium massiliense]
MNKRVMSVLLMIVLLCSGIPFDFVYGQTDHEEDMFIEDQESKIEQKEIGAGESIKEIDNQSKYEKHIAFRSEPKKTEIKVGETISLYAMVVDDEGNEDTYWDDLDGDVPSYTKYSWSSEDEKIAIAKGEQWEEDTGNITGISAGKVKIKIESKDCKNCEAKEIEITVIDDRPKYERHIAFRSKPKKTEIKVGETISLYAMVVDDEGNEDTYWDDLDGDVPSYTKYSWSSEDEKIATAKAGQWEEDTGNITGISVGKVKIKIESKDCKNCEPKEIEITVVEDEPIQEVGEIDHINISLDQDIKEIECGRNIKVNVIAKDKNKKEIKNPQIKWSIEPVDIVTIDEQYIIHTLKEGDVSIKAVTQSTDKEMIESNSITLEVTKSKTREEKIQEAIEELTIRYKNPTFYGSEYTLSKYVGELALSLRYSGMDIEEINNTKRIFPTDAGTYDLLNTSKNIMTLIAVNEDPKKEIEKILDDSFVFYEDIDENKEDKLVYAIIALDMTNAKYDSEKAVKALIHKIKKDDNGNFYFERYENPDMELTAKAMIAFSKHKDIDGAVDAINGIKKFFKSAQSESGLIKEETSFSNQESCLITSAVIQGIIAIGESPLDEYWRIQDQYKNQNNLVDAMLMCRDGQRFKSSFNGSVADIQTNAAMGALVDLKAQASMYHNIKYVKEGAPSRIEIKSNESVVLTEGDQLQIKAIVYDEQNYQIKNPVVLWESSDLTKATVENGVIRALAEGTVKIKAYLENNKEISDEIIIQIQSGISDEVLKQRVKEEIEFLKGYYKEYNQYEFLAAPAAITAGMDKEMIQKKIYRYSRPTALQYARMIIAVRGSGQDPRKDEFKKDTFKNYVDLLRAHQIKDGENKGQFIINESMDSKNIETLACCIMALDMVDADYNKEEAVKALLCLMNVSNKENVSGYEEIKSEALALTALAKHKDIGGVEEKINEWIEYIKKQQNEDGGFDANGGYFKNSPITTGTVIQGLIANGINPLYDKVWMKNKKTMLDSMLKSKFVSPTGDLKNSGFCQGEGLDFKNEKATYNAFAALVDMYENKSMFEIHSIKYDESIQPKDVATVSILKPKNDKILIGQELKLQLVAFDDQYNWIENPSIVWSSSDEDIASVKNGVVNGKKTGNVTITATVEGTTIKNEMHLSVEDLEIKNVKIQCNKNKIRKDDVILLSANSFDKIGNEIKGVKCIWSVDNENVANIYEEEGKIYLKALSTGKVVIKAVLEENKNVCESISIDIINKKSAQVKVRVEGLKDIIVPEIELEIDNFDMALYGNGNSVLKEAPTAMNALIKALKSKDIDCTDKNKFDAGMDLSILSNINGLKEGQEGPNSGWMYYINNQYVNDYFVNTTIKDGDSICVFYVKDYQKQSYSYFDKTQVVVQPNEEFTLNLKTYISTDMTNREKTNVKNAQILVNQKPYMINGENITTDHLGNATLRFDKEGEYMIGAVYEDESLNIVAAYCKVKVTNDVKNNKLEWSLLNQEDFHCGEEVKLRMKVKNKGIQSSNMICVIQLIDENNKVLKGSSIEKELLDGEETILSPGFAIPDCGEYKIKVFLTDEKIDLSKPVKVISIN